MTQSSRALPVAIVGHVDHGKSTLVGRLLHETGSLPPGKADELLRLSEKRGMALEWSFVLDALQAERDQAITIDTTRIWLTTAHRRYMIIDAPGHREFMRNMVTGATSAEAAILVVDALEGLREQTRRHAYLLRLLGVEQIVLAVNKMDLVGFERPAYERIREDVANYLDGIGARLLHAVPVAARDGDNLVAASTRMPWHVGPTLLGALEDVRPPASDVEKPLRLVVQDVYKFDERRIVAGRIESGVLRLGDDLLFSPSNLRAGVKAIEAWPTESAGIEARAGMSIGISLDAPIFVERGQIASHPDRPPMLTDVFRATVFIVGPVHLSPGKTLKLKHCTTETTVVIQEISRVFDPHDFVTKHASEVGNGEIAELTLRSRTLIAVDEHQRNPSLGRFALMDGFRVVAGGLISMEGFPDQRRRLRQPAANLFAVEHRVSRQLRAERAGHRGMVVWLTGLSGSGKSTLAMRVEQRLFAKGWQVYVLDGDNVRRGLNSDLGFSPEDRSENIRRVGEVAALFADAGFIAISAFISPYRADRDSARRSAGEAFCEVFVNAPLAVCERRDPKGLYKKARAGTLPEFTGISAPYETPESPDVIIDTARQSEEDSVERLVAFIESKARA